MSVLIKGTEMPTEGRLMTIYKLQGKFYVSQNGELCPLIELPDTESEIDKWWERSETVNAERSEDETDLCRNAEAVG